MAEKLCYSIKEVQEMLGISRQSAYALLQRGDFSYTIVGNKYIVSKKSFDAWLDNMQGDPKRNQSR